MWVLALVLGLELGLERNLEYDEVLGINRDLNQTQR